MLDVQYPDRKFNITWLPLHAYTNHKIAESVTIRTAPTNHPVDCHACRISSQGVDVGFTADTAPSEDHADFFLGCDLLVGEAFGLEVRVGIDLHKRGHSSAEDLGRLVAACKAKYVIPFHFGPECADLGQRMTLLDASGGSSATVIDPLVTPSFSL